VTGLGYTVPALAAVPAVVVCEVGWLRTGLFRSGAYWITMLIVVGFQIAVDGALTRLPAPVVVYNPDHISGLRFPLDIPVEDFLFGFALVTATLLAWQRPPRRRAGPR
jgi:lycopene cyclase domain-containing protein